MRATHLLDAVLDVLAEQGVGGLSVRSVAAAAGVSPSQVQYYYRAKSDLVRAGFDYASEQFAAAAEQAGVATLAEAVTSWLPLDRERERRARVWLAYAAVAVVDDGLRRESAALEADLRRWFTGAGLTQRQAAQLLALVDGVTVQCLALPAGKRQALVDATIVPFLAEIPAAHERLDRRDA